MTYVAVRRRSRPDRGFEAMPGNGTEALERNFERVR